MIKVSIFAEQIMNMDGKLMDIISKSCKLFTKFGIKSVSMDDIAKNCGISKKTLYAHVSDKRELVEKVLSDDFHDEHGPHTIDISELNALDALFRVYESSLEFFKDFNLSMEFDLEKYYPDLYAQTTEKRHQHLYDKILKNIEQGQSEGLYRSNFNADIITKFHVLKIETILKKEIFEDDNYSIADIFKELFLYHFYAIATEKGKIIIEAKIKEMENLVNKQ